MKKKFMLFLMAVMVSFSAICFASYGTDLDAETKMAEQFFTGADYKKVEVFMDAALSKEVTADKYKEIFSSVEKDLGKMVESKLRIVEKFDDADVLHYFAKYEKMQNVELVAAFKKDKSKIYLFQFGFNAPKAQAPAQEDNKAEKK